MSTSLVARELFAAVEAGDGLRVALLVARGAPLYERNDAGETVLHVAARCAPGEVLMALLAAGVSPLVLDGAGRSALDVALARGDEVIVTILAASVTGASDDGDDGTDELLSSLSDLALDVAEPAPSSDIDAEEEEEEEPPAVDVVGVAVPACPAGEPAAGDVTYTTVAACLARGNPLAALERALTPEVSVTAVDSEGRTDLHAAAWWGARDVVAALLDRGALVDARDSLYGATPLHLATLLCHLETAAVLVDAGASPLAIDRRGVRPLDIARHTEQSDFDDIFGADRAAGNNATALALVDLQNLEILFQGLRERYRRMLDGSYWSEGGTQTREGCQRMLAGTVEQLRTMAVPFPG